MKPKIDWDTGAGYRNVFFSKRGAVEVKLFHREAACGRGVLTRHIDKKDSELEVMVP